MKVLCINGVNLNMLGIREPEIYGNQTYKDLVKRIKAVAKQNKIKIKVVQTNIEGKIVDYIQKAYKKYDGLIINAGAYTHTSIAIADAIRAVKIKTVEVHLSDINSREDYRKISYISECAEKVITGKGLSGYDQAIEFFK